MAAFEPNAGTPYDAMLCDMNGPPEESIEQVIRLSRFLKPGGLVVFTLKVPRVDSLEEPNELFRLIVSMSNAAGLQLFAQTHLTYNRHEFTLFLERN